MAAPETRYAIVNYGKHVGPVPSDGTVHEQITYTYQYAIAISALANMVANRQTPHGYEPQGIDPENRPSAMEVIDAINADERPETLIVIESMVMIRMETASYKE